MVITIWCGYQTRSASVEARFCGSGYKMGLDKGTILAMVGMGRGYRDDQYPIFWLRVKKLTKKLHRI